MNGKVFFLSHSEKGQFTAFQPNGDTVLLTFCGNCGNVMQNEVPLARARELYRELLGKGYKPAEGSVSSCSRGGFGTGGTGVATPEAALERKERLFAAYHPMGYGTTFNTEELPGGLVKFRWHRYNSCD
jgi:hypothetical protein